MLSKQCRDCRVVRPITDFYAHSRMSDGHLNVCKPCVRARVANHRERNIERVRAYDRSRTYRPDGSPRGLEWKLKNPDRAALSKLNSNRVRRAVAKGVLAVADACEQCGMRTESLEGAHSDYSRPLDVLWLCLPCHRKWDARHPKTRIPF